MDSRRRALWRFVGLIGLLVGAFLLIRLTPLKHYMDREVMQAAFERVAAEPWSGPLFILCFAAGLSVCTPASVFVVTGGVVFGSGWGILYNWMGITLGSSCAFLIARYLGREYVRGLLGDRLKSMDDAVSQHGFWAIFSMRLIPFMPYNVSNFAAGLTGVGFVPFVAATAIAIFPGLAVMTWFVDSVWKGVDDRSTWVQAILAVTFLLALSGLPWLVKRWQARRRAVSEV